MSTWPSSATRPRADVDLPYKTPVVYGGDLNMVGLAAMQTLLTGNIHDEAANGPPPPMDGTTLREPTRLHSDRAMDYTWRNDNSSWGAGKLDYILVQDGVEVPILARPCP